MTRGSNKCKVRIGFFILPLILINCTSKVQEFKNAPGFELSDLNHRVAILSDYSGSKVVLLWFTNLCSGCEKNLPILKNLYQNFKKKGLEILAISVLGSDTETVEEVLKRSKVDFPFLIDPEGKVCELYSGKYIPETCPAVNLFLIDKQGRIRFESHFPGITDSELAEELNKILYAI